ncbi:MAG: CtsR family transcriptional regulator [Halanaerobiaceae bacterium]|nr:CtsR family transcriptional regulator [Halanaerobiaceae bacterium]
MASISDQIEYYLKKLIEKYKGEVEIKRNQLANDFNCAPSQINYVLETRFPLEKGYVVESQRGGGGYIRIIRIRIESGREYIKDLLSRLGGPISQDEAEAIIYRLYENELIDEREKALMEAVVNKRVIDVGLPYRDYIRGRIMLAMLEVILKVNNCREEEE